MIASLQFLVLAFVPYPHVWLQSDHGPQGVQSIEMMLDIKSSLANFISTPFWNDKLLAATFVPTNAPLASAISSRRILLTSDEEPLIPSLERAFKPATSLLHSQSYTYIIVLSLSKISLKWIITLPLVKLRTSTLLKECLS